MKISISKKIRYFFEFLATKFGIFIFGSLGIKRAARLGSFLAKNIGKKLSVQKLAKNNIKKALPKLSDKEIEKILDDMWDNLGRICGEFPYIAKFTREEMAKYVITDKKTLNNIKNINEKYNGGILFSAHTGNWEVGPKFFLHHKINIKCFYRPLNNEAVDKITSQARNIDLIAKNAQGNREIISEMKKGNYVTILIDQRSSDGIYVPFFHDQALTSPSIAKLALKYNIALIPSRIIRIGNEFKFKIEVDKPITLTEKEKTNTDPIFTLTKKINKKIESWVKEYPGQWFWVHDRWKKR
jgi:KDO2-lipid IV(A) lauroyltransferase